MGGKAQGLKPYSYWEALVPGLKPGASTGRRFAPIPMSQN